MSVRPAYTFHSLNGGEVSPRFEARQDQNKYLASLSECRNYMPLILGGLRRREGTVFVAKTKFSGQDTNKVRLMRFLFSTTQAYVIELGHLYARFFREDANGNGIQIMNGPVPFELVTPWNEDMLDKLYDFQSADVKDVCSDGTINVYRINRTALDTFTITEDTPAVPGVVEDEPTGTELSGATITLSAVSGDGITITASDSIFLGGDIDRSIESGAGLAIITSVDSATQVTADVISAFSTVGPIAAADWNLSGSGGAKINPSKTRRRLNITLVANLAIFRSSDVGKFVAIYGGFVKITKFQSDVKVIGHVYTTLRDAPAPDPVFTLEWTMYRNAWTVADGFPTCGAYFQDRRFLCRDQTVWGSVSGDYTNFALGSGDGDSINRTISDNEINPIIAVVAINKLLLMTSSGIYAVSPSQDGGPLTPNDFNVAPTGSEGAKRHVPLRTLSNVLYIQYGGRNIREFVFNFIENKYKSPDMFRLADHIVEFNSIKMMDYQGRPESFIWALREDGKAFPFVYERNEEVTGWARFETGENTADDGSVQSLCVIPRVATSHDWVWMAVNREVNGVIETYIEYLDRQVNQCREWREVMTDSALFKTAINFVISGLGHLEGRTVWIIGDGMLFNALQDSDGNVISTAVVVGGQVTVTPQIDGIASYEVGLDYQSIAKTLEPVIPSEIGGPLMARGWETCAARVRRTMGLRINGQRIPFRKPEDLMDQPIPLKKGKVGISARGCDSLGRITMIQDVPFPAEVLNIMGRVAVADEPKFDIFPEDTPQFFIDCVNAPAPPPPACPDSVPVAQDLPVVCCFVTDGWGQLSDNTAGSLSFVDTDESFWVTVSEQTGFASGPYPVATPTRTWYLLQPSGIGCNLEEVVAVPLEDHIANFQSTQTAQAGISGKSDEKSYILSLSSVVPQVLGNNNCIAYFGETSGSSLFVSSNNQGFGAVWAKAFNRFYSIQFGFASSAKRFSYWPIPASNGTFETQNIPMEDMIPGWDDDLRSAADLLAIHFSASFIYLLIKDGSARIIYQINKDTLAFVQSWTIAGATFAESFQFFVLNDDFMFLIKRNATTWSIGYIKPSVSTTPVLIDEVAHQCTFAGSFTANGFYYRNGDFYINDGGFGTGDAPVLKVGPLLCPSNPTQPFTPA